MRRLLALVAFAAAAAPTAGGVPAVAQDSPPRIFAFLSRADGVERQRLAEFGHCVDVVAPNWYELEHPRVPVTPRAPDTDIVAMVAGAGAELWPVVNGDFTGVSAPLARARVRDRLAQRIARLASRHAYRGITLDLEGIDPAVRRGFTALVRKTDRALARQGRKLAVYVPRRTAAPPNNTSAPYNWRALASRANVVLASGYNEHYAGGSPGPITTSAGFAAVLDYAAGISRRNVAPTLGAFGYEWPHIGGRARLIPATFAEDDPRASQTGTYSDGEVSYATATGVVWSETTSGLLARSQMAADAGFRWLGLFSLGREPSSYWTGCTGG